jgi:copper transport protein
VRRLAVALAALAALAAPAAASGHAILEEVSPRVEQRLEDSPRAVVLRFNNEVRVLRDSIAVLDPGGGNVARPARQSGTYAVSAVLPRLAKGPYTIRWRALSANDGHVVSGVYTFGVRYPAPPATSAVGTTGPGAAEHAVRWAYFVALALLLGGLAFRLVVVPHAPARVDGRLAKTAALGAVGVLEAGLAAFLLRADGVLQLPFVDFLYGDLSPLAAETRFGLAFMVTTVGFAVVASLLVLAWLTARRGPLWAAFALAVLLASGLSLSGHASEGPYAELAQLADWVHLVAAGLWAGGVIALVACVWPLAGELRRTAFARFARLATVLVALLLAAGSYLAIVRLPAPSDLWEESYGRVLLVKLGLVALALAWGGFHHVVVRPALARGGRDRFAARVRHSLLGEAAVAMAILLVAAVLVGSEPPPAGGPAPAEAAVVER